MVVAFPEAVCELQIQSLCGCVCGESVGSHERVEGRRAAKVLAVPVALARDIDPAVGLARLAFLEAAGGEEGGELGELDVSELLVV